MSLEIDPDTARERIDEFLDQIDDLLEKQYNEGKEEKRTMSTKLDNFAKVAFSDGEEKKNSLYSSAGIVSLGGKSHHQKQRDYEESLKRKKRQLEAWKQQIELEEDVDTGSSSINGDYSEVEEEISSISDELPIYGDDLDLSLEELRAGHYLSSAMITGRVIDHTIDQIKSSQRLGGPEEVLDHLEDNGIVDSREGQITGALKSYRDVYAHEVGQTPDITEALMILLGCAKLLHNIQEAGKAREYDLA